MSVNIAVGTLYLARCEKGVLFKLHVRDPQGGFLGIVPRFHHLRPDALCLGVVVVEFSL